MEALKCAFHPALEWLANMEMTGGLQGVENASQHGKEQGEDRKLITEDKPSRQLLIGPKLGKRRIVVRYDYRDEKGQMLYQVVRYEPKAFRMRHKSENGKFAWNMKGVRRVLYNLPAVLEAEQVWEVEGEKDADSLIELGFVATCNVGGAGKWDRSYTESLIGKEVIVCPQNDSAGERHCEVVMDAIRGKVSSIRLIRVPCQYKDISDFIEATGSSAVKEVRVLLEQSVIYSRAETITI
jgi:hypothetical protein